MAVHPVPISDIVPNKGADYNVCRVLSRFRLLIADPVTSHENSITILSVGLHTCCCHGANHADRSFADSTHETVRAWDTHSIV
jgi:hypothetical protein